MEDPLNFRVAGEETAPPPGQRVSTDSETSHESNAPSLFEPVVFDAKKPFAVCNPRLIFSTTTRHSVEFHYSVGGVKYYVSLPNDTNEYTVVVTSWGHPRNMHSIPSWYKGSTQYSDFVVSAMTWCSRAMNHLENSEFLPITLPANDKGSLYLDLCKATTSRQKVMAFCFYNFINHTWRGKSLDNEPIVTVDSGLIRPRLHERKEYAAYRIRNRGVATLDLNTNHAQSSMEVLVGHYSEIAYPLLDWLSVRSVGAIPTPEFAKATSRLVVSELESRIDSKQIRACSDAEKRDIVAVVFYLFATELGPMEMAQAALLTKDSQKRMWIKAALTRHRVSAGMGFFGTIGYYMSFGFWIPPTALSALPLN